MCPCTAVKARASLSPHCEWDVVHQSFPDVPPPPLSLSFSLQIVAAILAIAGIVMMTYADGFHSHSVIGITFVVASASMSALYKVLAYIRATVKNVITCTNLPCSDTFIQERNGCVWIVWSYIRNLGLATFYYVTRWQKIMKCGRLVAGPRLWCPNQEGYGANSYIGSVLLCPAVCAV